MSNSLYYHGIATNISYVAFAEIYSEEYVKCRSDIVYSNLGVTGVSYTDRNGNREYYFETEEDKTKFIMKYV